MGSLTWLAACEIEEQRAFASGLVDRGHGRPSRADQLPEDVRAFYVAGWEGA